MKNQTAMQKEINDKLTPLQVEQLKTDEIIVPIAKVWASIDLVMLEAQRSMVNQSNVDTIAPTLLANAHLYKLLKLFADAGESRLRTLEKQKHTK